jgi:hypothetical protein
LETTILGKYYDYITPFGSGGQPFQIYNLSKKGISDGNCRGSAYRFVFAQSDSLRASLDCRAFLNNLNVFSSNQIVFGRHRRASDYRNRVLNVAMPMLILIFSLLPKVGYSIINNFYRCGQQIEIN